MERIGPFEVHERLGRGGMGAVHRAVEPRTGQEVALKLLGVTDERARRRFLLEGRALARLRHRNVVSLLDVGEDRARPWIALELVRGRSLQARLDREGPLPAREAAALVRSLAAGLAHAHREGVLHRDLKPDNVLLPGDGGEPKLTDFGLAGFAFDLSQSRLTQSGPLLSSPGYWAPEQATGQTSALGPRTDVYGLGGVLYACLTGRPPIEARSLPELLIATERRLPEPPRKDRDLDAITLRCLEKRPEDRYPSVEAVARELSRYLAGVPPTGGGRRGRARALGAAITLAALIGGTAWSARPTAGPGAPAAAGPAAEQEVVAVDAERGERPDGATASDPDDPIARLERSAAQEGALADRVLAPGPQPDAAEAGEVVDLDRAIELDPRSAVALTTRGALKGSLGTSRAPSPTSTAGSRWTRTTPRVACNGAPPGRAPGTSAARSRTSTR